MRVWAGWLWLNRGMRTWTDRFVGLAMAGVIAGSAMAGLWGCGSAPPTAAESGGGGGESAGATRPRIAVSIPAATHGWTGGVVWWANRAAEELSERAEVTVVTADSPEDQARKLETIATQGYDALVVLSFEPALVTPTIQANRDAFGYIVSVDRGLTEPIADVWLRGDNVEFGRIAGKFMADKLGGRGNILVFRGIAGPIDEQRVEGFQEVMRGFPDVKILAMEHGDWSQEKAYNVAQALLLKHPKVDAIWASDDDMALGIEKALSEANRAGVWMVGGGGMKDVVKRVKEGDALFPATVTYPPRMIEMAIKRAVEDLAAGKKPGGAQVDALLPIDLVTPANAQDFFYADSIY